MPITQPGVVVTQGLGGAAHFLVTQGFGVGAITETISPVNPLNPFVVQGGTVVFTVNFASSFVASAGSLVVAGDNLSATWTAPGTPGSYTVTATDLTNPGNKATAFPDVLSPSGLGQSDDFVPSSFPGANRGIVVAGG